VTVVVGAFVVELVDAVVVDVVDRGLVAGVPPATVDAGAVESGADDGGGDPRELWAAGVVPLHPPNVNRGSEIKTAVRSQ
jgi:hypothetical protein